MLQAEVVSQLMHERARLLLHRSDVRIGQAVAVDIARADVPPSQRNLEIIAGQLAAAGAGARRDLLMREDAVVMREAPLVVEICGFHCIEIADP